MKTTTKTKPERFAPTSEALALLPQAFGAMFEEFDVANATTNMDSDVRVISIRGPLMHRAGWWFDSYESIKSRVAEALAGSPKKIVLDIDSPGGVVSGAFEASRELRAMCDEAGVELHAFVDSLAASAGYAIASAATYIGATKTAELGSIGVIATMQSMAERNKMDGFAVTLVTSGERKGDGWPDVETSEGAVAAAQKSVDTLAGLFFELVSDHGWGGTPDEIRAMQAGVVHGEEAVALGLASEITTLEQMVSGQKVSKEGEQNMSLQDARATLEAVAEGDDEEEAKTARALLAAMDAEDDDDDAPDAEDDDDAPDAEDDDDAPDAEDDDDAPDATDDDADPKSAYRMAVKAQADVHKLKLERKASKKRAAMRKFLGGRPDLPKSLKKNLAKLTLAEAKQIVSEIPKGPNLAESTKNAVTATGTKGGAATSALGADEKKALDDAMGMTKMVRKTVNTDYRVSFGVPTKE